MADKYGDSPAAIVVGGGPAGLTAAITLAAGGVPTTLAGRRPAKNPTTPDNRTTALLAGSITALETLGVWDLCGAYAAPLKIMRIVDDTGRLWRAPEGNSRPARSNSTPSVTTSKTVIWLMRWNNALVPCPSFVLSTTK